MAQFQNPAGLFVDEDEMPDDNYLAAQSQGREFIEVELNPKHVRGGRLEPLVRFSGVKIAKVFEDGLDDSGLPRIVTKIKGGAIEFRLNHQIRKWIGRLLDCSYNRKFLRSHMGDPNEYDEKRGWIPGDKFKIVDEKIQKEVEAIEKVIDKDTGEVKWVDPKEKQEMDRNTKLEEENAELKQKIQDLEALSPIKDVVDKIKDENANDKTDDNQAPAGGQRVEQNGGQGNTSGSKRRSKHPAKEGV